MMLTRLRGGGLGRSLLAQSVPAAGGWRRMAIPTWMGLKKSFATYSTKNVRNVAIIAHVDHGKTTLVDKLLSFCGNNVTSERAMDSNEHEKERGITIMSKYTRLYYKDHTLHVVDTPGHADFGGEVERILSMVDGVVLLVDASEGPMSQTKFVLGKAIAAGKKPIVVLNKVDREGHRADEVECEILELFCALTSNEDLLHYPQLYASGRQGWVTNDMSQIPGKDVVPLLDAIIESIPSPNKGDDSLLAQPFSMSVNTIQTDLHLGRIVTGKVETGSIKLGDPIKVMTRDGQPVQAVGKVTKLFFLEGLKRVDVDEAHAGEIVSLAGSEGGVADTVCSPEVIKPIETVAISPPILSMTFGPNDSPMAGREGSKLTSSQIKDRLRREIENNVALQLKPSGDPEAMDVQGRGELQLGILVETMRREGFELIVSPPEVLPMVGEDQITREPFEEVTVDVDLEYQGMVIEAMSNRKGAMKEFKDIGARCRLVFSIPSRGMMGFRHEILTMTRGNATVNSMFSHYDEVNRSEFYGLRKGKLVSMDSGRATGYALTSIVERGSLFIDVGEEIYEGMVIGENNKQGDLDVNPCRLKRLTNMRTTEKEEKVSLPPPRRMSIEQSMAYMNEDEVLEVTPKSVRLRKRILDSGARARATKSTKPR